MKILLGFIVCATIAVTAQAAQCESNRDCRSPFSYCCQEGGRSRCVVEQANCVPLNYCGKDVCLGSTPFCCGTGDTAYCTVNSERCLTTPCGNSTCPVTNAYCCGRTLPNPVCTKSRASCPIETRCGAGTCSFALPFCCGIGADGYCVASEDVCVPRKSCGDSFCTGDRFYCCGSGSDVSCTANEEECPYSDTICGGSACLKTEPACCEIGGPARCLAVGAPCEIPTTTIETTTEETTVTTTTTTKATTEATTTTTTATPTTQPATTKRTVNATTPKYGEPVTGKSSEDFLPIISPETDSPKAEKRFTSCGGTNCTDPDPICCGAGNEAQCGRVQCEEADGSDSLSVWLPIVIVVFIVLILLVLLFVWKCTPVCASKEGYEVTPKIAPVTLVTVEAAEE